MGFLISDVCLAVASLGIAFHYCWQLSLVLLATVPLSVIVLRFIDRGVTQVIQTQQKELAQASKYVFAAVTGIDMVKVYNGFDNETWQYTQATRGVTRWFLTQARKHAMQIGYMKLWMISLYTAGFWFAVYLVEHGLTTAGKTLTTFYAGLTALQAVEGLAPQWLTLVKGMSAGRSLRSLLMMKTCRHDANRQYRPQLCIGDIQLKNISFAYPTNPAKLVLNKSSFFFPAGETTFLVGPSGSGKSTISKLIVNLYQPLTGHILVDGRTVQKLDSEWVRGHITVIQQASVLFNDSIFMNVALGGVNPTESGKEDVEQACDAAMLQSTLANLPEGLYTKLGPGAHNLSGGQRQRVALARARLRDPAVLIFDEITSGLDPVSKHLVMETIRAWRKGKTTIFITHDVSQIQSQDYVYVLDKGSLAQEGFQKDLANYETGVFASMIASSAEETSSSTNSCRTIVSQALRKSHQNEVYTTSRISRVIPQMDNTDILRLSWPFNMGLCKETRRSALMREKDTREMTFDRDNENHSQLSDLGTKNGRQHIFLKPSSDKSGPDYQNRSDFATSRRSSLDFIEAVGQATRAVRHPNTLMEELEWARKMPEAEVAQTQTQHMQSSDASPKIRTRKIQISAYKIISTAWPVLSSSNRARSVVGICACLVTAVCNPAFSYVFAQLLAALWAPASQMAFTAQTWAIFLAAIAITDGSTSFLAYYLMQHVGQAWITSLRIEALKRTLSQPKHMLEQEQNSPTHIVQTLDRSAEETRKLVGQFVPTMIIVAVMMSSSLVWALVISWRLTLVTLATTPAVYFSIALSTASSRRWEAKTNGAAEKMASVADETFQNISVVKTLAIEKYFTSKHNQAVDKAFHAGVKKAIWTGVFFGWNQGLSWWLTSLVLWFATVLLTSSSTSPTLVIDTIQVINLLLFSMGTAMMMLQNIPQLEQAKASAVQILYYATLSYRNSHEGRGESRTVTPFPIEMRNLQFTYSKASSLNETRTKVLRNLTLWIDAGDYVAIVGPSGSGKSTLANVLLRVHEPLAYPATGERPSRYETLSHRSAPGHGARLACVRAPLSYGYMPADELSTPALRCHMAYVPQHAFLFPTTIRENVLYGLHPDSPYREQGAVLEAAKLAGAHEFIVSLEEGYATVVGEGGLELSGGQMQRINIARALVRKPKLLVLDEPTSALDEGGAEGIRAAVGKMRERDEKMAVVVVTHNQAMMRAAGRIVVVDEGRVVEEGRYEELLARKGGQFAAFLGVGDGRRGRWPRYYERWEADRHDPTKGGPRKYRGSKREQQRGDEEARPRCPPPQTAGPARDTWTRLDEVDMDRTGRPMGQGGASEG